MVTLIVSLEWLPSSSQAHGTSPFQLPSKRREHQGTFVDGQRHSKGEWWELPVHCQRANYRVTLTYTP